MESVSEQGGRVRPSSADSPATTESHGDGLGVAAVARKLGVAPETLRSWHRRYGLGPSGHATGRHRRYVTADLERLEIMRGALLAGASTGDAAKAALSTERPGRDDAPEPTVRTGGRRSMRLPGADRYTRRLLQAALGMDPERARAVLREAVGSRGVVAAWEDVASPVLRAIGERWAATGTSIEAEHLLTTWVLRVLGMPGPVTRPRNGRPVLLACVPDDHHDLPLSVLATALAEQDVAVHLFGAALPEESLRAALRRVAPAVVVLWAQTGNDAIGDLIERRPRTRTSCRWFVAGPGWDGRALPHGVERLTSLPGATQAVTDQVTVPCTGRLA